MANKTIQIFKTAPEWRCYTEDELAAILGITRTQIIRARTDRRGIPVEYIDGEPNYRHRDVKKWIEQNPEFTTGRYYVEH